MRSHHKFFALSATILAIILLAIASPQLAIAQGTPTTTATAGLSESIVKSLQEALIKQGIAVQVDGILSDETRSAIRKYQSQHHLPITGEPDKATLDKLGAVSSRTTAPSSPQPATQSAAQAPGSPSPAQSQSGMMMGGSGIQGPGMMSGSVQPGQAAQGTMMLNCPMMQGSAHETMQMMQRMHMMQGMMIQMMQAMMQSGQMRQPGQMQPGAR